MILMAVFIAIFCHRIFTREKIQNEGILGVAEVVSIEHVYNQGLFIIYEYELDGKSFSNRKSIRSRKTGKKYLNKFFEISILEETPEKSLINLEKEIKNLKNGRK